MLVHNGVNASSIDDIKIWAEAEKAIVETLAPNAAPVKSSDGNEIPVDGRQNGEPSVTYDAVIVIDGNNLEVFKADGVSKHYVLETYKHLKPIVFLGDKCALIDEFSAHEGCSSILYSKFLKRSKINSNKLFKITVCGIEKKLSQLFQHEFI